MTTAASARPTSAAIFQPEIVQALLPLIDVYQKLLPWDEIVPISAQSGDGADRLIGSAGADNINEGYDEEQDEVVEYGRPEIMLSVGIRFPRHHLREVTDVVCRHLKAVNEQEAQKQRDQAATAA